MSKKIIIFGAGVLGKKAINYFGSKNVHCFADNNKAGAFYCGKHVVSFEELIKIKDDYDVVIAATPRFQEEIERQCLEAGIKNCRLFADMLSLEDFESNPALSGFKNIYDGKRCFVIGNGASLKPSDLDVLARNGELEVFERVDFDSLFK